MVPLLIHGNDITPSSTRPAPIFTPNPNNPANRDTSAVGATPELCVQTVESCADAFTTWKDTPLLDRRNLFNKLAALLREQSDEIQLLIQQEIMCSALWAKVNVLDSIVLAEDVAARVISGVMSGFVPVVKDTESHAVVVKEPLGVVIGIAPWNAPLILGLRSVAAAVAAGNTAILKGSEMSPRTHYLIANLFREAGFPPGVLNYVQHRPEDAAKCFESMISHKAVQKCNFTGSTAVGRRIAQCAALHLKPVLLELGGKNFVVVLEDADLKKAAEEVIRGAFLNSGQICMSTDLVLVANSVEQSFGELIHERMSGALQQVTDVIDSRSQSRINALVSDALEHGAKVTTAKGEGSASTSVIEHVTADMDFWRTESFGPLLGIRAFESDDEAVRMVNDSLYGLSSAIFSRNHLRALKMAKKLEVGAVHVNSATVHDEASLPHGGRKESGWGRFGADWGFEEFLQTKTIILHP